LCHTSIKLDLLGFPRIGVFVCGLCDHVITRFTSRQHNFGSESQIRCRQYNFGSGITDPVQTIQLLQRHHRSAADKTTSAANHKSLQTRQLRQTITNSLQTTQFRQRITISLQTTQLRQRITNSLQTAQLRQ
jgi:hypothetical protein